jgi:tetratricopeptide (TPR) repeat protein
MATLKKPVTDAFDKANKDLNDAYAVQNKYSKALDKKFKALPAFTPEDDALGDQAFLINRAIAMHLLREGQFDVASTFLQEANANPPPTTDTSRSRQPWEFKPDSLQKQFSEMYNILHALRQERNLAPAITWARRHSYVLESRGSNLEFELFRLQFALVFSGADTDDPVAKTIGPFRALAYARSEAGPFQRRYESEICQLSGAAAYWENIGESPYRHIFSNESAWDEVAGSFTREFCSMLGLSADSPLYVAATAGSIALPVLNKAKTLMKVNRTEWTTAQELPVSTYLALRTFEYMLTSRIDRDTPPTSIPLSLHLRLPRQQRASYRY